MKDNHMVLCVIAFFLGIVASKLMSGSSIESALGSPFASLLGDNKKCGCGKRSGSCTCGN